MQVLAIFKTFEFFEFLNHYIANNLGKESSNSHAPMASPRETNKKWTLVLLEYRSGHYSTEYAQYTHVRQLQPWTFHMYSVTPTWQLMTLVISYVVKSPSLYHEILCIYNT